jgi:hypothetical protein
MASTGITRISLNFTVTRTDVCRLVPSKQTLLNYGVITRPTKASSNECHRRTHDKTWVRRHVEDTLMMMTMLLKARSNFMLSPHHRAKLSVLKQVLSYQRRTA